MYAVLAPEAVFKLEYMFLFCTFTLLFLLVHWILLWVLQVIIYRPCNGFLSVRIYSVRQETREEGAEHLFASLKALVCRGDVTSSSSSLFSALALPLAMCTSV